MKKATKVAALLIALVLTAACFAGCKKKDDETASNSASGTNSMVTLKVWGAQEDQAMLAEMVEEFKKQNPEKTYDITFGVVGEKDSVT